MVEGGRGEFGGQASRQEQEEDEVEKNWNGGVQSFLADIIGYQEWEWQADGAIVGTGLRELR